MKHYFLTITLFLFSLQGFSQASRMTRVNYDNNIFILDSTYIIIPIIWKMDGKFSSLKFEPLDEIKYKNLIFYNFKNDSCKFLFEDSLQMLHLEHLIDDSKKVKLSEYSFKTNKDSIYGTQLQNTNLYDSHIKYTFNNFLLYKVINEDFNDDGKLNSYDPVYLYVSKTNGTALKRITPKNYYVKDYQFFEKYNFMLVTLIEDFNSDKKFDSNDREIIYKIDLSDLTKSKIITNLQIKNQ